MADPILNIVPDSGPAMAPAGANSAAQPISNADLQRELSQPKQAPREIYETKQEVEDHTSGPKDESLMSFAEEAKKLEEKKRNGETEEPAQKPVKREKKAKVEPVDTEVATKEENPAKPQETAKEEAPSEELPEAEKGVLPTDKPSTAKRIQYFLKQEAKLKQEAAALKAELEAAKKAPATQVNLEEVERIKQEKAAADAELTKFRRRYEIDNDPEFKTKFDEPIQQTEKSIEDTLKKYLSEATIAAVKGEGGFGQFSRSGKTFSVQQLVNGEPKTVTVTAAQLARQWLDGIPIGDAEFVKSALGKQQLLDLEKKATIEREVASSKEYFTQREEKARKEREAAQQESATIKATFDRLVTETESTATWLKDKEVPANASAEQKKEIEDYNKFQKELRGMLRKHPTKPEEYVAILTDAAQAHHLRREEGNLRKELDAARAEIAKLKGGMKTTPKSGSLMTAAKAAPKKESVIDDNWAGSLREQALKMGSGEDSDE